MISAGQIPLPSEFPFELTAYDAGRIAERLGINERICCSALTRNGRRDAEGYFTKMLPVAADESLYIPLGKGIYAPCPELVFLEMAAELSLVELIRFGFDLCGTYVPGHGSAETMYGVEPLACAQDLVRFCEEHSTARYAALARRAAGYVLDYSASPAESVLAMRFILPNRLGGYGTERPEMNSLYGKSPTTRFPDLYWERYGIDIEYDSGEFHQDSTKDAIRRNQLQPTLKVFTVTCEMGRRIDMLDGLAGSFFAAANLRFRPRAKDFERKKRELHQTLLAPEWYKREGCGPYRASRKKCWSRMADCH